MSSPVVLTGLLTGACTLPIALSGCSGEGRAPTPGPAQPATAAAVEVVVRDGAGALVTTFAAAGDRCTVSGAGDSRAALVVTTADGAFTARRGDAVVMVLADGRTGRELTGGDGRNVGRVHRDAARPGRVDLLDVEGIALARISTTATTASIVDAGRAPLARLTVDADRAATIAVVDADGAGRGTVTGTTDLELAALLAAPRLAPEIAALVACDHTHSVATRSRATAAHDPARGTP